MGAKTVTKRYRGGRGVLKGRFWRDVLMIPSAKAQHEYEYSNE